MIVQTNFHLLLSHNEHLDRIDECQIPGNILKNIPTTDLLNICLQYPLLNNYTASNSPNKGLAAIISTFNGLTEFMSHSDSHKVLLNYYANESVSNINNSQDNGGYTFDFCAVELLLSQPVLLKRFTQKEQKDILNLILSKYNEKAKYEEYFGFYGKMTTAFVSNRYAESLGKATDVSNKKKELFTSEMLVADFSIIDQTILDVSSFAKAQK